MHMLRHHWGSDHRGFREKFQALFGGVNNSLLWILLRFGPYNPLSAPTLSKILDPPFISTGVPVTNSVPKSFHFDFVKYSFHI